LDKEVPLGGGKGFKIVIFHTNSTGMLAPLNGVIAAGINDIQPNGESELTAWRWESGIPLPPPQANSTSGANATDPFLSLEEEEEEQQQCTVGASSNILFIYTKTWLY
jgi:hypothetical protein